MRKLIFILIEFIGIGTFFTGVIFKANNYHDVFYGIVLGPIIVLVGLLILLIKNDKFSINKNILSSRITLIYKTIALFFGLIFFLILLYLFFLENKATVINYLIIFDILEIIFLLCFFYFIIKIKVVSIKSEGICVIDFFSKKEISFNEIIFIKRFLFLFYKINTKNINILIIPRFSEFLKDILDEPESIRRFKNTLYESKMKKM